MGRPNAMVPAGLALALALAPVEAPARLGWLAPGEATARSDLALQWSAPSECPPRTALEQRIAALVPGATGEAVVVDVALRRVVDGFEGEISLHAPRGTSARTLHAPSCASVVEAMALLVAVAIEPLATERALQRPARASVPDPPAVTTPSMRAPMLAPVAADPVADPPRTRVQAVLRLAAEGGLVPLPRLGMGVGVALGLRHRWLRAGAHARAWPAQHVVHPRDAAVSAELRALAFGAHLCGGPRWTALELPICGGLDAGVVHGRGRGALVVAREVTRPWVALHLGPALVWSPVPAVGLWLGFDVVASVLRPRFTIDPLGSIHDVPEASGRAFVAVEVRAPRRSRPQ